MKPEMKQAALLVLTITIVILLELAILVAKEQGIM